MLRMHRGMHAELCLRLSVATALQAMHGCAHMYGLQRKCICSDEFPGDCMTAPSSFTGIRPPSASPLNPVCNPNLAAAVITTFPER